MPSIEQIRQEYREAVASAIEGRDDLEAWNRVRVSLANAVFSAWLSSACKTAKGIPVDPVEKVLYAKSGCGAGSEGNEGFQEGNTCAGEGGTAEVKTTTLDKATVEDMRGVMRTMRRDVIHDSLYIFDDDKSFKNLAKHATSGFPIYARGELGGVHVHDEKSIVEMYLEGDKIAVGMVERYPHLKEDLEKYTSSIKSLSEHQKAYESSGSKRKEEYGDLFDEQGIMKDDADPKRKAEWKSKAEEELKKYHKGTTEDVHDLFVANTNLKSAYMAAKLSPRVYTNKAAKEGVDENGIHHDKSTVTYESMQDFIDKKLTLGDAEDCEIHSVTSEGSKENKKLKNKYPAIHLDAYSYDTALPKVRELLIQSGVKLPKVLDIGYGVARKGKAAKYRLAFFTTRGFKNSSASQISVDHRVNQTPNHQKRIGRYKTDKNPYHSYIDEENPMVSDIIHEVGHVLHSIKLQNENVRQTRWLEKIKEWSKLDKENKSEVSDFADSIDADFFIADFQQNYRTGIKGLTEERMGQIKPNKIGFRRTASKVSEYATSQEIEFVAETFTGLVYGKKYDDDVMGLYKDLGGPEVGAKS